MKKTVAFITATCLFLTAIPFGVFADDKEHEEVIEITESKLQDNIVTTKHSAVINGKELSYTAKTGSMVLESGGELCEMFFTSYTLDGEDPGERPITFAFNGGPGSSSNYIQMGCLGPRRVELDEKGHTMSLPAKIVDNENSILDLTDLVFIDPVTTGYSHAVDKSKESEFIGYENDIRSVGDFIRLYINRNKRWGSEKYIAGESYGTFRAVGLCEYLADTYNIYVNGLMLISAINNFAEDFIIEGNDTPYAVFLPTFAADAWYHKKLSKEYTAMALEDYLDEVRDFVANEYVPALFKGNRLEEAEKDKLAEKIASYTGISKEHVLSVNNRLSMGDFCSQLFKDEALMVGRLDGRLTGPATSGTLDDGSADPSSSSIDTAFGNTYLDYLTNELGFETDIPYIPLNPDTSGNWSFPLNWGLGTASQEKTIYECMSKNKFLKIWVICGYYDAATPFYGSEWIYSHVFLDDERKDNLRFTYYPSGHMFYADKASFDQFRKDAEEWY